MRSLLLYVSCLIAATANLVFLSQAAAQNPPAKLPVPENVVFEPGLEFANPDGQHLKLDLARPKEGGGPLPAVLCIHGGGFRAGSRDGYDALCLRLAERGYVAVTVDYRLAPKYPFPAAVHDTKEAVCWLRDDLALYAKLAEQPKAKLAVRQRLTHWQEDADLACVRDQAALDKLPDDERRQWRQLWADVAALLKKVVDKK